MAITILFMLNITGIVATFSLMYLASADILYNVLKFQLLFSGAITLLTLTDYCLDRPVIIWLLTLLSGLLIEGIYPLMGWFMAGGLSPVIPVSFADWMVQLDIKIRLLFLISSAGYGVLLLRHAPEKIPPETAGRHKYLSATSEIALLLNEGLCAGMPAFTGLVIRTAKPHNASDLQCWPEMPFSQTLFMLGTHLRSLELLTGAGWPVIVKCK